MNQASRNMSSDAEKPQPDAASAAAAAAPVPAADETCPDVHGFSLFYGLEPEPYGILPRANLVAKGGPTSAKQYKRVGSYNWNLQTEEPVMLTPGVPRELVHWHGGKLPPDHGVIIYDCNHLKMPRGPLDPLFLAAQLHERQQKPDAVADFQQYDIVTDAVNLQKLFAFCLGDGEGLFRIDVERVGNTVMLTRCEASDLMETSPDVDQFDQGYKFKVSKPRTGTAQGPFFQLASYTFGQFKMLVRYEVDCADYAGEQLTPATQLTGDEHKFELNEHLKFVDHGKGGVKANTQLFCMTTYPQSAGFPCFTWAQLFFTGELFEQIRSMHKLLVHADTGADGVVVGWYKSRNEFNKAAIYRLSDISKFLKPLPLNILGKVHDCLVKVVKFMKSNHDDFRIGLVWKGQDRLEIFEKHAAAPNGVTNDLGNYLFSQAVKPEGDAVPKEEPHKKAGQPLTNIAEEPTPTEAAAT